MANAVAAVASDISVVGDNKPVDDKARRVMVIDTEPLTATAMATNPDVLVEPEILHWTATRRPTDFLRAAHADLEAPVPAGSAALDLRVTGGGKPLEGAQAILNLRGAGGVVRQIEVTTDANGDAHFAFPPSMDASALVVVPAGGYWTMVARGAQGSMQIDCPPLPATGPLGWWHGVIGESAFDLTAGTGIRVGVIDTGVGPHPNLAHVTTVGAFIDGGHLTTPADGQDIESHGSHVCGTIGARPLATGEFGGIAPGANLACARVFPPGRGANQGDIANAIDELSRNQAADLLNLSLGATEPSAIEQDAIRDALERGTLTICAAGNSSGPVGFPAAFPESVAVSALGLLGTAPAGTLAATRLPQEAARFGDDNLYLANFSCFGPEIECATSGVDVFATVPARFGLTAPYAAMDGTSMASPVACAALAVLLSRSPEYQTLPRDQPRSLFARRILRRACRDVGLAVPFEGQGVPAV
jgi:subtilisin